MFQVRNIKTNTTFNFPTLEEAVEMVKLYKNLELVENREQKQEQEKPLLPLERYVQKPKTKKSK